MSHIIMRENERVRSRRSIEGCFLILKYEFEVLTLIDMFSVIFHPAFDINTKSSYEQNKWA